MKNSFIRWLLAINLVVFCCIAGNKLVEHQRQQRQAAQAKAAEAQLTQELLKVNKINPADYERLVAIGQAVEKDKSLPDDQLMFVLSELTKTYDGKISVLGQCTAEVTLACLKSWSPAQEQAISRALMPLLASNGPDQSSADFDHSQSCKLLAHFGAREAVPNILPLLNSPSLRTRSAAKQALQKLGYTTS